jgi:hypothetical protein
LLENYTLSAQGAMRLTGVESDADGILVLGLRPLPLVRLPCIERRGYGSVEREARPWALKSPICAPYPVSGKVV